MGTRGVRGRGGSGVRRARDGRGTRWDGGAAETHLRAGWRRGERQPARVAAVDGAHVGAAPRAAIPRCGGDRGEEKGGQATSPRQSWPASSSRSTPWPARPGGAGTHRQPGRAARPTCQRLRRHAPGAAFLPASQRGAPTARWPLALLLLPPAGPGTMRGVEGGRAGRAGGPRSSSAPARGNARGDARAEPRALAALRPHRRRPPPPPPPPRGTGSPLFGEGENGAQRPPRFLLSHIWQSSGLASPHPSSSSWRHWAAFPALHGDPPKRSTQQIEEPKCSGEGRGEGLRGGRNPSSPNVPAPGRGLKRR